MLIGLGAVLAGATPRLPATFRPTVSPDRAVDPERARDALDPTAESSPTLVADPTRPDRQVLVNRVDRPRTGCAVRRSSNGGLTWASVDLPPPVGSFAVACFAPDASFAADGALYVAFTSLGSAPSASVTPAATWLAVSYDGAATFTAPRLIAGPRSFQLRIAADATAPRTVYATWLQAAATTSSGIADGQNPIVVSRSDDAGASWSTPVAVSPPARTRVVAPSIVVAARSSPVVAYLDVGDDRLDYSGAHGGRAGDPYLGTWSVVVARSSDGGRRWKETALGDVHPVQRFSQLRPPTPTLAVDRAGRRAFVATTSAESNVSQVVTWSSHDGATTFDARLLGDASRERNQFLPALAVAPGGRLDVVYYEAGADPTGDTVRALMRSSNDHGRSFSRGVPLSHAEFDRFGGFGSAEGLADLGSRTSLLSTARRTLAVWGDARASAPGEGREDLATAAVSWNDATPARAAARWGGGGLATGGVLAIGLRRIQRRRGRAAQN